MKSRTGATQPHIGITSERRTRNSSPCECARSAGGRRARSAGREFACLRWGRQRGRGDGLSEEAIARLRVRCRSGGHQGDDHVARLSSLAPVWRGKDNHAAECDGAAWPAGVLGQGWDSRGRITMDHDRKMQHEGLGTCGCSTLVFETKHNCTEMCTMVAWPLTRGWGVSEGGRPPVCPSAGQNTVFPAHSGFRPPLTMEWKRSVS